ncbi:hypothetical protein JOF41_002590 [Saccharothrix coeruleofusca]|uniref:hypothetical protein n=1 Tax=Saccharothrix coeruleofusca TaxID=33919 RepID=UPI001AEA7905|nr:hypothetical protein [Saccharothrix coeruleofusca]MBP2336412.1 hypothetical protein [Saccharothrix coeruleofusca]
MCFDAGLHEHAERCSRFAVGCATEADDWAIRAKALSGMANLAVHRGRVDEALSYAEMSLVRLDRLPPVVRAVLHTRHARALGAMGVTRQTDCLVAVRRAEDTFAIRAGEEPDWISYYDRSRLDRDTGRALLGPALGGGDHREAEHRLSAAVGAFPDRHSRGRALALANLAVLMMTCGDPVRAAELGTEAIRSDRVVESFRRLRAAGQRHRAVPSVRELNRELDRATRVTAG